MSEVKGLSTVRAKALWDTNRAGSTRLPRSHVAATNGGIFSEVIQLKLYRHLVMAEPRIRDALEFMNEVGCLAGGSDGL